MRGKIRIEQKSEQYTMPYAICKPESIEIVKSLKEGPKLPEELCQMLPYDEKTIIGTLLDLHAHGVLDRKQSGFKGFYSISKERLKKYCLGLKEIGKKWESVIQEF